MAFLRQLIDANEREVVRLRKTAVETNALEPEISRLSDSELQAKTPEFKERIAAGETVDEMLPEIFAVCREAGKRTIGMRHFDVQIMGGQVLHEGKVAEMKTGEGKTLVATLAVYANALLGNYDATERLLHQYLPPERVVGIMDEIRGPAGRNMWEKLSNVQEQVLANYLKNEYPQTVAVVLSALPQVFETRTQ